MNNLNNIALICEIINHLKEGKTTRIEEDCDPTAFAKGILMYLEENTGIFTPESINRFLDSLIDYYKSELERTITHLNSVYGLFPNSFNPGPGIRELPYMPGGWTPGEITCSDAETPKFNGVLPDGVPKTPLYTSALYGANPFRQMNGFEVKPNETVYEGATRSVPEFANFCKNSKNLGRLPMDADEYEYMRNKYINIFPQKENQIWDTKGLMTLNNESPRELVGMEDRPPTPLADALQEMVERRRKEKDEKYLKDIKTSGFGTKYSLAALQHKGLTETAMKLYHRLPVDYDEYTETINNYIADNPNIPEKDLVKDIVDPEWIKDAPDNWNPETEGYRCMSYPTDTENLLDKVKSEGVSTKYSRAALSHKGLTEKSLKLFNRLPVDYDEYYRVYYCYAAEYCISNDEAMLYKPELLKEQPESWGLLTKDQEKVFAKRMADEMKRGIVALEKDLGLDEQMTPQEQKEYMGKMEAIGVDYSKQDSITKDIGVATSGLKN